LIAVDVFYAVAYRYPGASADKDTAREALKFCKEVRQAVRLSLGLTPEKARSRFLEKPGLERYLWFEAKISEKKPGFCGCQKRDRDRV
jgi:hypothetical protein